jgi:hypothetical protein
VLVIPYTPALLRPETARWGVLNGAEFHNVAGGDLTYWRMFRTLWLGLDFYGPLCIVEHDIVPSDMGFTAMQTCGAPWCTQPYVIRADGHMTGASLGCVKFSRELMVKNPDLADDVGPGGRYAQAGGIWSRLDGAISDYLTRHHYEPHAHSKATHLHDYVNIHTPWTDPFKETNRGA